MMMFTSKLESQHLNIPSSENGNV